MSGYRAIYLSFQYPDYVREDGDDPGGVDVSRRVQAVAGVQGRPAAAAGEFGDIEVFNIIFIRKFNFSYSMFK